MRAGGAAERQGLVAKAVAVFKQQDGHTLEHGRRSWGRALHQWMPGCGGQHERVVTKDRRVEATDPRVVRHDRGVDARLGDLFHQRLGLVFAPDDGEVREGVMQRRRHLGQQIRTHGGNDADAQRAAQRIALLAGGLAHVGGRHQYLAGPHQHGPAGGRQAHAAGIALEQLYAERLFEAGHLRAQRRLRYVTGLGGAAKPTQLGDRDEVLQLPHGIREGGPQPHSHRLSLEQ